MRKTLTIFLLIFITSCAQKNIIPSKEKDTNEVKKLNSWTVNGKISYQEYRNENHFSGGHGSLHWKQELDTFKVQLIGPGNTFLAYLESFPNYAILKTKDNETFTGKTIQEIIDKNFQWKLPINNITYWIKGIENPNVKVDKKVTKNEKIIELQQNGWKITFEKYEKIKNYILPKKIVAKKDGKSVKVIIYEWII